MTEPTAAEILRGRLRKYFLVVFGLIAAAFAIAIGLSVAVGGTGTDPSTKGLVLSITLPLLMLGVVGGSWVAVAKLWRCPQCDRKLFWSVSTNMSIFAAAANKNCPSCGVELFTPRSRTRAVWIIVAIGVIFGMIGVMTAPRRGSGKSQTQQQQQQQPIPPG